MASTGLIKNSSGKKRMQRKENEDLLPLEFADEANESNVNKNIRQNIVRLKPNSAEEKDTTEKDSVLKDDKPRQATDKATSISESEKKNEEATQKPSHIQKAKVIISDSPRKPIPLAKPKIISEKENTTDSSPENSQLKKKSEDASAKSKKVVARISTPYTSSGQILQEARVRNGLSLHQVEQITKIKKAYIEALEHDNYDDLPHYVFVKAYVKHLCELYKLSAEDAKIIFEHLKKNTNAHPVSEEILQHIEEEKQVNEEEETKIKWMIGIVSGILIIGFLLICWYIYILVSKFIENKFFNHKPIQTATTEYTAKTGKITEKYLEKFIIPPDIEMTELAVPKKTTKYGNKK